MKEGERERERERVYPVYCNTRDTHKASIRKAVLKTQAFTALVSLTVNRGQIVTQKPPD